MPYPVELIRSIAQRHGLVGDLVLLPRGGMVNEAWSIGGSAILRIVAEGRDPECDQEAAREAAVVPLAVAAGMSVPPMIACDASMSFAPRPYSIYERAKGDLLGFTDLPIANFEPAFRQIGQELALLHAIDPAPSIVSKLFRDSPIDIAEAVRKTVAANSITSQEGEEIVATMAHLAEIGGPIPEQRLIHNDIHPWNLMCDLSTGELTAIIDWGDATYGDPARDFASMPLQCLPAMVEGYGRADTPMIARSIVVGTLVALGELRNPEMTEVRHWWRMPPGGWHEMRQLLSDLAQLPGFPDPKEPAV